VAKGRHAFVSHHIGDLENYETLRSFTEGIEHFRRLFDVTPELVAHDLHPEYLSTRYAVELEGVELLGVQHHHAHVASSLADIGEAGPVIGVAFDGTGWGGDGTIWGGELLAADLRGFERLGHLQTVPLPGGAAAIREPWRMAAVYLQAAFGGEVSERLAVVARNRARRRLHPGVVPDLPGRGQGRHPQVPRQPGRPAGGAASDPGAGGARGRRRQRPDRAAPARAAPHPRGLRRGADPLTDSGSATRILVPATPTLVHWRQSPLQ
jgi:hypothetical protein